MPEKKKKMAQRETKQKEKQELDEKAEKRYGGKTTCNFLKGCFYDCFTMFSRPLLYFFFIRAFFIYYLYIYCFTYRVFIKIIDVLRFILNRLIRNKQKFNDKNFSRYKYRYNIVFFK